METTLITPFYLSGRPTTGREVLDVTSPWDGSTVGTASIPTDEQVEQALSDLASVRIEAQALPAHVRADALDHVSAQLRARSEEMAQIITAENGKPLFWSRGEVGRAVSTFRWAAEEARRFSGELQRLDTDPASVGRVAIVRRFPRGPVLGITPFNFPLNLVAHKLAPAIAAGAPILIKPAPATPLTAMLLAEILAETDLPAKMVSFLPVPNEAMPALVQDPRLPVISFTGSGPVGWSIQAAVPRKHVTLELGGNAAVIVNDDWTDLAGAANRIALFAHCQAGQSCISVQRVLVHEDIYDGVVANLVEASAALSTGDPTAEGVQVGPVINEAAARRIVTWVDEARTAGAHVLTGGTRDGASVAPTVLTDVKPGMLVADEEIFGPVLVVTPFANLDEAFALTNASRYGLQAGLFTRDVQAIFRAHRELEVGGVIVGDVPSFRSDQMPYGGWKDSGVGREGVKSAMTDLTEERVLVLTGIDL
jgi:acyl-CoA reductase-like NAD-dependent aldehyde dehydrogenase